MRRELTIFGYFGRGNLGDETNLRRLIYILKNNFPEFGITVITANPHQAAAQLEVTALSRLDLTGIWFSLLRSDCLIGGCGNVFQDRTSLRSLFYYSFLVFLAKLSGAGKRRRVILYGQGIGPIRTGVGKWLAVKVLSMVDMMILRDRISVGALYEWGANTPRPELHFTAEPLLALDMTPPEKVASIWELIGKDPRRKIGLVVQCNEKTSLLFWKQLIGALVAENRCSIYLITIDEAEERVWRQLALQTGVVWLQENRTWERLQGVLGGVDLVVSVKLHGLVAAVNQGIPCIGMPVDPKIEGFCLQLDIPLISDRDLSEPVAAQRRIIDYFNRTGEPPPWLATRNYWKAMALENERILIQYLNGVQASEES